MNRNINPMWNRLHLILELVIAVSYVLGLIPFLYLWVSGWLIPLTLISVVFAFVLSNGTTWMTIINVIMSVLSLIPVIGYLPRIIGIVISVINMLTISRSNRSY